MFLPMSICWLLVLQDCTKNYQRSLYKIWREDGSQPIIGLIKGWIQKCCEMWPFQFNFYFLNNFSGKNMIDLDEGIRHKFQFRRCQGQGL